jgi:molybdate transport system substrate-binding protein
VKVIGKFPENSHPPIIYPAALTPTAKPEAKKYLDFLRSGTGQVVLESYGFTYLVKAGP